MFKNYWLYFLAYIILGMVIVLIVDKIFKSISSDIIFVIMLISFGIIDYLYQLIEKKKKALSKSIRHVTAIVCIGLITGIVYIPLYLLANLSTRLMESLYEIFSIYLFGVLFVYFTTLTFSILNKTKFISELESIIKFN